MDVEVEGKMKSYGGMQYKRSTAYTRYGYCETKVSHRGKPGAFPFNVGDNTEVRAGDLIAIGDYFGCALEVASVLATIESQGFTGRFYYHALGVLVHPALSL